MRRVGGLLAVALLLAAGAAAAAFAVQSPSRLQASILAAAAAKKSVHYVVTNHATTSGRMVCDVARDRGIQRITFTKGGATGHVTVLVVDRTAYIRGDAFALHAYMGFTSAQASQYHGRWIAIPHGFPSYATVAAGVTLASVVHELKMSGSSLVRVAGKLGGDAVIGVRRTGTVSGLQTIETLYAQAHGAPLPVEQTQVAPAKGYRDTTTLSRWNEPVRVVPPANAVPISIVAS